MPKGDNPNSHGNRPRTGIARSIRMSEFMWEQAERVGDGNVGGGARLLAEVGLGARGILWAVPLSPVPLPRSFPIVPHEHITLWFGCYEPEARKHTSVTFTCALSEVVEDDRIQAVRVILPTGIPFEHQTPHLTLSHKEGVLPFEATAMLEAQRKPGRVIDTLITFRTEFFQFSI